MVSVMSIRSDSNVPYESLTPDKVLDAIEDAGLSPSGGLLALNSYENRVYQISLEDNDFVIAKFYRPGRWSDAAIVEEHTFTQELFNEELSVVPPLRVKDQTLLQHDEFRFALFPRQGGHAPNLENEDDLEILSRAIARMHALGAQLPFEHREGLTSKRLGHESRQFLLQNQFLPMEVESAYDSLTGHLLERIDLCMENIDSIRIHGDCHMGNVLWREGIPHFVDFDDCKMGPGIQDLWMLLSGDRNAQQIQLRVILDAYRDFFDFDPATLTLIEPLRTLRIMHHAAWIARRWSDPAFPSAFPTFNTVKYWSEHILTLREQMAMLEEPALTYLY